VIVFLSLKNQNAATSGRKAEKPRVPVALVRAGLGLGLVIALVFGLLLVGGDDVIERVVNTGRYGGDVTTGRAHFWRVTLNVIRSYPLLGTGLGAFGVAYTRFDTINPLLRLEQAHNDYLQLLADAGIVGGLLGLIFVVVLFRQGLRRINTADKFRRGVALGALGGCSGVLMHSFFEFALHAMANALLFLVLAALATISGQVEEAATPSHSRRPSRRRRTTQHDSAIDNNTSRLPSEQVGATGAPPPPQI
jgi:O-antigen ligase